MKELNLTDKSLLQKKLESHTKTFQFLLFPFLATLILTYFAFRKDWVAQDFPPFVALLSLVILAGIVFFISEIFRIRKAITRAGKTIVAGRITKKLSECDEYNSDHFLVVAGKKIEVEPEHFNAFKTGDHVKMVFSFPGNELINITPVSQKLTLTRAYRKAKIQAKRFRK